MSDTTGNMTIEQAEYGGITLQLSNYAALALLRRLQGIQEVSDIEGAFIEKASKLIEGALEV